MFVGHRASEWWLKCSNVPTFSNQNIIGKEGKKNKKETKKSLISWTSEFQFFFSQVLRIIRTIFASSISPLSHTKLQNKYRSWLTTKRTWLIVVFLVTHESSFRPIVPSGLTVTDKILYYKNKHNLAEKDSANRSVINILCVARDIHTSEKNTVEVTSLGVKRAFC